MNAASLENHNLSRKTLELKIETVCPICEASIDLETGYYCAGCSIYGCAQCIPIDYEDYTHKCPECAQA